MRLRQAWTALLASTAMVAALAAFPAHAQTAPEDDDPARRDGVFATDTDGTEERTDAADPTRPRAPVFGGTAVDDDTDDAADDGSDDGSDDTATDGTRLRGRDGRTSRPGAPRADDATAAFPNATRPANNEAARPAQAATRVGIRRADGSISPLANPRTLPVQGGATPTQPDPYDPLGLRLGPLRLTTVVEQGLGYTTNADDAAGGSSSTVADTRLTANVVSDFAVNELRGTVTAQRQTFLGGEADDIPQVDAEIAYRYDYRRDTEFTFGATYAFTTENATDEDVVLPPGADLDERLGVHRYSAYAEAARIGTRLTGALRLTFARDEFEDGELADGTPISQEDRDVSIFSGTLRVGYERTAAFRPFADAELGYRLHDRREDSAGFNRDGTQYALRGGVALDFGATLSGEIAAGIEGLIYESNRLEDVVGPSVSGLLTWTPNVLTTVRGTLTTRLDAATTGGQSGSLAYDGIVDVTYDWRDNVALTGLFGVAFQDFDSDRRDLTLRAEAGILYRLNRALAVQGRLAYLNTNSTDATADFDVTTATIGLRIQK